MKKMNLILQLLVLFVLPVALIKAGFISAEYRYILLSVMFVISIGIGINEKWPLTDWGIRMARMKELYLYGLFTLIMCMLVLVLAWVYDREIEKTFLFSIPFLSRSLYVSIAQEVVYRGFLMKKLRGLFKLPMAIILINAFLFALIHIVYPEPGLLFGLTFVLGIGFAWIYYRFPNLILISLSHAIINCNGISIIP